MAREGPGRQLRVWENIGIAVSLSICETHAMEGVSCPCSEKSWCLTPSVRTLPSTLARDLSEPRSSAVLQSWSGKRRD